MAVMDPDSNGLGLVGVNARHVDVPLASGEERKCVEFSITTNDRMRVIVDAPDAAMDDDEIRLWYSLLSGVPSLVRQLITGFNDSAPDEDPEEVTE